MQGETDNSCRQTIDEQHNSPLSLLADVGIDRLHAAHAADFMHWSGLLTAVQ